VRTSHRTHLLGVFVVVGECRADLAERQIELVGDIEEEWSPSATSSWT
jgi:hypothetical protein